MSRHRSAALADQPRTAAPDSATSGAEADDRDLRVTVADPGMTAAPAASTGTAAASSAAGTIVTGAYGTRSSRKKKGLFRRTGIVLPAAGLALLLVVVVWGAARVLNPQGTGASSLFPSIDGLGHSGSVLLLEQERQTLVQMTAASRTLSVVGKPSKADPEQILEAQDDSNTQSSSQTTGGTGVYTTPAPADPSAAEQTAEAMLPSFGFSSAQWPCLYDIWERESGWNVYAENAASGAYGIPQSLPGDKMASAGADWETDATTQIRWGLGYIQSVYGTPCQAWANEEAYGYY